MDMYLKYLLRNFSYFASQNSNRALSQTSHFRPRGRTVSHVDETRRSLEFEFFAWKVFHVDKFLIIEHT